MMKGVRTVEDVYTERADLDQSLDKVADPLLPADLNEVAQLLTGSVIEECSFTYEGAEDKHPAAIRLKCISPDGSVYYYQFGYEAFLDQAFSVFFKDPKLKVLRIWESAAGYYSLIGSDSEEIGGDEDGDEG